MTSEKREPLVSSEPSKEPNDPLLERALDIGREYDKAMAGDDEAAKSKARELLRETTEELRNDSARRLLEPEFGRLRDTEEPRCYTNVEGMSDAELESVRVAVRNWLDGRTDLFYLSPPRSRPTSGDLRVIEAEIRRRRDS
jgi:hypothetical protein